MCVSHWYALSLRHPSFHQLLALPLIHLENLVITFASQYVRVDYDELKFEFNFTHTDHSPNHSYWYVICWGAEARDNTMFILVQPRDLVLGPSFMV